jgi:hypothetical protein
MKLSEDLILHILNYLPFQENIYEFSQENLSLPNIKNLYNKKYHSGKKIIKWFQYYTAYFKLVNFIFNNEFFNYTQESLLYKKLPILGKKLLVHLYVCEYEKKHLYNYPEFFIKKMYNNETNIMPPDIKNYYLNMPQKVKTYDVYKFLKLKSIKTENIQYVGW